MQHSPLFLLLTLLIGPQSYASPESTQLALALKQLDGVKTSLERARNSASADSQSRYFFDNLQAQQDLTTVEQGIQHYLAPARAQPRAVQPLSASYQRENPDDWLPTRRLSGRQPEQTRDRQSAGARSVYQRPAAVVRLDTDGRLAGRLPPAPELAEFWRGGGTVPT